MGSTLRERLAIDAAICEEDSRYRTWHAERIRRTASLVRNYTSSRALVLDVGAGPLTIEFANLLEGRTLHVLDPGTSWAQVLGKSGIQFINGSIMSRTSVNLSHKYDAIVLAEVFEHIAECPRHVLPPLIDALAPGGVVVITTPNQARWLNRIRLLLGVNIQERPETLFHKEWMGFGHLREYTIYEMESEFRCDGLMTVEIGSWSPHPLPRFDQIRRLVDHYGPRSLNQVLYSVFRKKRDEKRNGSSNTTAAVLGGNPAQSDLSSASGVSVNQVSGYS